MTQTKALCTWPYLRSGRHLNGTGWGDKAYAKRRAFHETNQTLI